ncbi:hypothetical protein PAMP_006250 [Pampus punctatissimus]
MAQEVCGLKAQLKEKEKEIIALKKKLAQLEKNHTSVLELHDRVTPLTTLKAKPALCNEDIMRYSRQLLLPELGVQGQLNLSKTSVLVVGCGGLGCPLAQYLAAAGIGRLGLLDYDEVELSNLHRQVLHGEENQGQSKALSAANAVRRLNSTVECVPYHMQLSPENALQLIQQYPAAKLSAYICYIDLLLANCHESIFQLPSTKSYSCLTYFTLTLLTSYMTLWRIVQTMPPLVIL